MTMPKKDKRANQRLVRVERLSVDESELTKIRFGPTKESRDLWITARVERNKGSVTCYEEMTQ